MHRCTCYCLLRYGGFRLPRIIASHHAHHRTCHHTRYHTTMMSEFTAKGHINKSPRALSGHYTGVRVTNHGWRSINSHHALCNVTTHVTTPTIAAQFTAATLGTVTIFHHGSLTQNRLRQGHAFTTLHKCKLLPSLSNSPSLYCIASAYCTILSHYECVI